MHQLLWHIRIELRLCFSISRHFFLVARENTANIHGHTSQIGFVLSSELCDLHSHSGVLPEQNIGIDALTSWLVLLLNIIFSAIFIIILSPECFHIIVTIFVAATKGVAGVDGDVASALAKSIASSSRDSWSFGVDLYAGVDDQLLLASMCRCQKNGYKNYEVSHVLNYLMICF